MAGIKSDVSKLVAAAGGNMSFIDQLVKDKLTKEKIYYYRQLQVPRLPNDQQYVTGG